MDSAATVILHGRIYWLRHSKVLSDARDRRQIPGASSALVARDGYPSHVRPVARDTVQCAHRWQSRGAQGRGGLGPVGGPGRGGDGGARRGGQASLFRENSAAAAKLIG